ncbi:hypothetical protein F7725_022055 [Dissostichus mawsoni]|uniref:AAA+ ATPase domain-containing protein n=1 Tax=Dissostichus mawsoni TaxID=36200 RepID=A0A7J5ZDF3_DISMA|nr:hypothetical protein F7725_022055 [Dissostichus mawsoni]
MQGKQSHSYLIGSIGVSGKTKWDVLDGVIRRLFKEYVFRVDPLTSLGLSSDSIVCYRMGDVIRSHTSKVPELLPCGYLVGDSNIIKPIIQRYLNLLMEHRRIILSGPSGTGKSFLAAKLAEFIISQLGQQVTEHNVASFNVDQNSSKDLRQYLSNLAEQCNSEDSDTELPTVVILDNLHHIGSLSDIFNGFLNCKYHKWWVLCTNHTEPWVNDTYPWSGASQQPDAQTLLQLRPEDVGYDSYSSSKEGASSKQVSQSDTDGDPLEAANYSSTQSYDSDSTSHHDDQLDSSLESAL